MLDVICSVLLCFFFLDIYSLGLISVSIRYSVDNTSVSVGAVLTATLVLEKSKCVHVDMWLGVDDDDNNNSNNNNNNTIGRHCFLTRNSPND